MNYDGSIVFLGTNNLEATHKFYSDILSLPLYKDQGACRIYDVPGGGRLGFCTHIPVIKTKKSPIITLLIEDVDSMYARMEQAGISLDHPPQQNSNFKIYHFFATDPNGYCLEIQRFLD